MLKSYRKNKDNVKQLESDLKTYDNLWKIDTGQGDEYTTGSLPDHPYFEKYYKLIAID